MALSPGNRFIISLRVFPWKDRFLNNLRNFDRRGDLRAVPFFSFED
jgi:hypothetical protein